MTDDDDPSQIRCFHSLENEHLSQVKKCYPLSFIHRWRKACSKTNVHRTLKLLDNKDKAKMVGPFLIDIDNEQEDLDDALSVARRTVKLLKEKPFGIQGSDLRIFFSGHKGFNIEVRPSSLQINISESVDNQIKFSATTRKEIIEALQSSGSVRCCTPNAVSDQGTVIDTWHPFIRLHDSINAWIVKSGYKMARRRIRLGLADLFDVSAEQICQKAQPNISGPRPAEP